MTQDRVASARDTPRQRQGRESREAILEATLAIASERGYDGTTMALVMEKTGLLSSSIYWHFGNKDKLLAATLEYSYEKWRAVSLNRRDRPEPGRVAERVAQRLEDASRTLADAPQFWTLGLMLSLRAWVKEPEALAIFKRVRAATEQELSRWWLQLLDPAAVEKDPDLPDRLGRFWIVMLDGVFLQQRGTSAADTSRLLDRLVAGVTHYLVGNGLAHDH